MSSKNSERCGGDPARVIPIPPEHDGSAQPDGKHDQVEVSKRQEQGGSGADDDATSTPPPTALVLVGLSAGSLRTATFASC